MNTIVLPVVPQVPEVDEQVLRLERGEHRRRLVEDQDVDAPVQRLQDLDALLLADGELLDHGVRLHVEPVRVRELRDPSLAASVSRIGLTLVAEDDVLGDGERVHQHEVLVDHADAQARSRRGATRSSPPRRGP